MGGEAACANPLSPIRLFPSFERGRILKREIVPPLGMNEKKKDTKGVRGTEEGEWWNRFLVLFNSVLAHAPFSGKEKEICDTVCNMV